MLEATLLFYNVDRCGYYDNTSSDRVFGSLETMLSQLQIWAFDTPKPLIETCTFDRELNEDYKGVFCFDIAKSENGDYLLVTWNETETLDGRYASVDGDQPAGTGQAVSSSVPKNHIPGFPAYFWFIPDKNMYVSIKHGNQLIGRNGLESLLQGFQTFCSDHAVIRGGGETTEVIGYRENSSGETNLAVEPRFKGSRARIPGQIELIKRERSEINKVIKKTRLDLTDNDNRSLLGRILKWNGYSESIEDRNRLRIKTELSITPSADELENIILNWSNNADDTGNYNWHDVGFQMAKKPQTLWLSKSYITQKISLDIDPAQAGVYQASSILRELSSLRHQLLI